jgi:hypothetical protein
LGALHLGFFEQPPAPPKKFRLESAYTYKEPNPMHRDDERLPVEIHIESSTISADKIILQAYCF